MIKYYIDKIVNNGKKEDMECLEEMFEDLMHELKESDYEEYKEYKMKLLGMANDYKFDEEMAKHIVENMKPLGEYWSLDTTNEVKTQFRVPINEFDFYVVMNALVNDYGNIISAEEVETYVKMAIAFVQDQDAEENKVWKYFTSIVKD